MKLVLFDIDGTLIYHVGGGPVGLKRFAYALGRVYGVPGDFNPSEYNGMIDRQALAKLVFEKSKRVLGQPFAPADIVVVGDTVHDIRAGKAIGAKTIAVTTGLHGDRAILAKENPDFMVDSLMEKSVRDFFGV